MSYLQRLNPAALARLAVALESGRLDTPISASDLRHHVPEEDADAASAELCDMVADGMQPRHIARLLHLLAEERKAAQVISDRTELVWSGLDLKRSESRDTGEVIRILFRDAKRNVLISSYSIDKNRKADALFGKLAARMDVEPELSVRIFLNVARKPDDRRAASELLREFAETFRHDIWPGARLPEVFHDPRSLEPYDGKDRGCLHAKCIIIDEARAFVTSANFSEAAQARNIEAGVLVDDSAFARTLKSQFDGLVERNELRRVPGI